MENASPSSTGIRQEAEQAAPALPPAFFPPGVERGAGRLDGTGNRQLHRLSGPPRLPVGRRSARHPLGGLRPDRPAHHEGLPGGTVPPGGHCRGCFRIHVSLRRTGRGNGGLLQFLHAFLPAGGRAGADARRQGTTRHSAGNGRRPLGPLARRTAGAARG